MRILSMGGGVNSVAGLIKYYHAYDAVVFADTQDEHQETYEYLGRYIIPFCHQHGIKFVIVGLDYSVLEGAERHKKPERFFWQRQCSRIHKIRPILRWIRRVGKARIRDPCTVDICFAFDESDRIGVDYYPKYAKRNFPLVDDKITRTKCKQIISDYGWDIPPKSGCDHCFMAGKKNIRKLLYTNPDKVKRLAAAEQRDPKYPERTIFPQMSLQSLIDRMSANTVLENFIDNDNKEEKEYDANLAAMCSQGCHT